MFLPLVLSHLRFLQRTPPVTVSVEDTMACDGYIGLEESGDGRCASFGRNTLEPGVVHLIETQIMRERDKTILLGV